MPAVKAGANSFEPLGAIRAAFFMGKSMVKVIDVPEEDKPDDERPAFENTTFGMRMMLEEGHCDAPRDFLFTPSKHRWRTW